MHFYQGILVKKKTHSEHTAHVHVHLWASSTTACDTWFHCSPRILILTIQFLCDVITYHAAEVAAHKDVVERGQLQVGGPQVPGQLQTFTVRHAAAPVRRTQRACTRRAFIWTQRGEFNSKMKVRVGYIRGNTGVIDITSCFLGCMNLVWTANAGNSCLSWATLYQLHHKNSIQ